MNILSFDIEEWYIEKMFRGGARWKYDAYDAMLERLLDTLDAHNQKATFFCLGALIEHFPGVVRRIADRGHEIGCHSYAHKWVNQQTREQFLEDTHRATDSLRQATGQPVESYRAPAFSIGKDNIWAFDVLAECGIRNDASIFPGIRDFGGFPSFPDEGKPCRVMHDGNVINEFPITLCQLPVLDKKIAYSGGGYFRLLPTLFVKSQMRSAAYTMCYFHIADLVDFKSKLMSKDEFEKYFKTAGTLKNRLSRYVKSNVGRRRAFRGLESLLDEFSFLTVAEAANDADNFSEVKI